MTLNPPYHNSRCSDSRATLEIFESLFFRFAKLRIPIAKKYTVLRLTQCQIQKLYPTAEEEFGLAYTQQTREQRIGCHFVLLLVDQVISRAV